MPDPVRRLTPADAPAYTGLRAEMLVDSPFSFLGTPGDDRALNVDFIREQVETGAAAHFGVFDPADPARLLAVAVLLREARAKMAHRTMIVSVYVTPRARGARLGRAVVEACIEGARRMPGVEIVGLSVSSRASAAQRLYESLGFVAWGLQPDCVRVDGVSDDEIHLQRRV